MVGIKEQSSLTVTGNPYQWSKLGRGVNFQGTLLFQQQKIYFMVICFLLPLWPSLGKTVHLKCLLSQLQDFLLVLIKSTSSQSDSPKSGSEKPSTPPNLQMSSESLSEKGKPALYDSHVMVKWLYFCTMCVGYVPYLLLNHCWEPKTFPSSSF